MFSVESYCTLVHLRDQAWCLISSPSRERPYGDFGKSLLHSFSCRVVLAVSVHDAAALRLPYGAFGAQSRYRIRPTPISRICSDVRGAGRCGLSLEAHQPLPTRPPRLFQLRLKPRPVGVQLGMTVSQRCTGSTETASLEPIG